MASFFKRTRKRKDGSSYEQWCGEFNYNGESKTVYGKTKNECEEKIREFTTDKITYGVELDKTNYTVAKLLYSHLFTNIYATVADSTFDRYMCLYNKHIKDSSFGNTLIVDVRQMTIQKWFTAQTISSKSLSMIRYLLRQAFDFAINNNYIRINPVINIKLAKSKKDKNVEVEVLSKEDQPKYIAALDKTKYKILYLTALYTGMRRGEILALKWENVDLVSKTITVKEARKRYKKWKEDGTSENTISDSAPKTKNAYRILPIPHFLNDLLLDHKSKQGDNNLDLVFISSNQTPVTPELLRTLQISICKRAKIKYVSFHALRHTYATRLIESGADVKTVSKLLGHSDVIITLNTYVHDTMDSKRAAADLLGDPFKKL
jgi:integrase